MLEFDLIERIRRRVPVRADVALGIGDDCALLVPPSGMQLAVSTDTLNAGVHFPRETAAGDIGWKALAVNLSDLAAIGAQPAWCTLSLTLPEAGEAFVDGFLDGFLALAQRHGVSLVGGDSTHGALAIGVTVLGFVAPGAALLRSGARVDDEIWVSGTLGDAAGALSQWRANVAGDSTLRARLDRPTPRVEFGDALRGIASACIDVSDGLLADLGHVCKASGVGAMVDVDALPVSPELESAFASAERRELQATGGDDYELCFTAPADRHADVLAAANACATRVTCVGHICEGRHIVATTAQGEAWRPSSAGFVHFW